MAKEQKGSWNQEREEKVRAEHGERDRDERINRQGGLATSNTNTAASKYNSNRHRN